MIFSRLLSISSWPKCKSRYDGRQANKSWERDHNHQANICQVYPSTNDCQINQLSEQYDNYSLDLLLKAQLLGTCVKTTSRGNTPQQ
jgi:hypothetical protein